ncbi:acyl-CoA dehydrogenase family protein [Usitatibacter palustris]|uniref:Acyl-CoA dehydrogenase FadE17 n=1 Tax=Usitatibacter palustris TaxID=2732487 RepID=A0A6M4H3S2_9PROT|nr:acyl-CoA dehydrogenase family protein [Usitatibacter palustris]QJR13363.1 Putative acyl-CoA dehydrogenase FadE17 [Usitatibacter palustris]
MDLEYTASERAFRDEVRAFVTANLPADLSAKVLEAKRLTRDDFMRWHKILAAKGWVAAGWPQQYGGPGWTPVQQHLFDEECAAAGAPVILPFGVRMVAPVIMAFGSQAQKDYFLPRILSGEDWWCQGYSEPGSGSDLASLKTRAERQGDHYIVNGQKTWNTLGQYADWIFCLVRTATEGRPQEGISFLLIDMKTPGVTVRPIRMLDGEEEINEVWFENVKVPVDQRVGEENKGWTYAKFLLGHERTGIAGVGKSKRELQKLKGIARKERASGRPLIEDARFRDRIAQIEIELLALEVTNLRVLSEEGTRKGPGPEASILKVRGSEIQQSLSELMMQAVGHYGVPYVREALDADYKGETVGGDYAAPLAGVYFNMRKTSIYSGSNEIQKNIISQMVLGL